MKADRLKLDGNPKGCTIEKGKGGELKLHCLHGHPLIGVEVSTLSTATAIDNLDNGLKKASFRPHDEKN